MMRLKISALEDEVKELKEKFRGKKSKDSSTGAQRAGIEHSTRLQHKLAALRLQAVTRLSR